MIVCGTQLTVAVLDEIGPAGVDTAACTVSIPTVLPV
jgi:hypothetical protein